MKSKIRSYDKYVFLQHSVTQTNVSDFFVKLTREIVEHRQNYNITKFDAMQSLIDLLKKGYVQDVNGLNSKSEKSELNNTNITRVLC